MSMPGIFGIDGSDTSPGFCPDLHGLSHFAFITVDPSRMP
jgi:hypothetical protein